MSVLKVKMVQKIKNGPKIVGYTLQDCTGSTMNVASDVLKRTIREGKVEVINMTLTSDNRLIEKAIEAPKVVQKPVMQQQPIKAPAPAAKAPTPAPAPAPVPAEKPAANEVPNSSLKDEATITVSQLSSVFQMCEEEDTVSFEHGSSMQKSVTTLVNKAKVLNRVLKTISDDVYFVDFGNNNKVVVALAKSLVLIDG